VSSNLPALHVVNNLLPRTNDLAHGCPSWFILIPNCCYVGIGTRAYTTAFDELWSTRVTSVNWANTEKYNWKRYKGRITVLILGTDHLTWRGKIALYIMYLACTLQIKYLNTWGVIPYVVFSKKILWFPMLLKKIFWYWCRKKNNLIQSFCNIT
jgi:hypothetical protein